jgi:hypothetical protein
MTDKLPAIAAAYRKNPKGFRRAPRHDKPRHISSLTDFEKAAIAAGDATIEELLKGGSTRGARKREERARHIQRVKDQQEAARKGKENGTE